MAGVDGLTSDLVVPWPMIRRSKFEVFEPQNTRNTRKGDNDRSPQKVTKISKNEQFFCVLCVLSWQKFAQENKIFQYSNALRNTGNMRKQNTEGNRRQKTAKTAKLLRPSWPATSDL
jgi:hypothetical protein